MYQSVSWSLQLGYLPQGDYTTYCLDHGLRVRSPRLYDYRVSIKLKLLTSGSLDIILENNSSANSSANAGIRSGRENPQRESDSPRFFHEAHFLNRRSKIVKRAFFVLHCTLICTLATSTCTLHSTYTNGNASNPFKKGQIRVHRPFRVLLAERFDSPRHQQVTGRFIW